MHSFMDLRYVFPPLINVIFFLFLTSQGGGTGKPWDLIVGVLNFYQHPILKLALAVFSITLLILFLFISIKLPLIVNPVHFRVGDFSSTLTISLIASVILPPPLFWLAFAILMSTSVYPSLNITFTPQHQEIPQPAPPQVDAELV